MGAAARQLDLQLDAEAIAASLRSLPVTALLGLPQEYDLGRAADVQPRAPAMPEAAQPRPGGQAASLPASPKQPPPAQPRQPARQPNAAALDILQGLGLPSAAGSPPGRPAAHAALLSGTSTPTAPAGQQPAPAAPLRSRPQAAAPAAPRERDVDLDELLGVPSPDARAQAGTPVQQGQTPSVQRPGKQPSILPAGRGATPQRLHALGAQPSAGVPQGTDDFDDFLESL